MAGLSASLGLYHAAPSAGQPTPEVTELIVLVAPVAEAPEPEELVDAVNSGGPIPGGFDEGDPYAANLVITRRATGATRETLDFGSRLDRSDLMKSATDRIDAPTARRWLTAAAVSLLLALSAVDLDAAIFVVTKETDDDGPCEVDDCALREAVLAANAAAGPDTILLPGGTYQLSIQGPAENFSLTGDLDVRDELEILGDETTPTMVIGEGTDRVLHALSTSLLISDLIVTGGMAFPSGGGILASVSDLTILNSTIRGNSTQFDGGGIFLIIGNLLVLNSTISGNSTGGNGFGGGIQADGITPSTLSLVNSTVSGNSAFLGGGIYTLFDMEVFLTNSTIAGNVATFGGEAFGNQSSPRPTFANTLFVGSCSILSSQPISRGGNIESPGDTCQLSAGDRHSIPDAGLGPLRDNGGPTWTHALLAGSPAIDTAVDAYCPVTDQRGLGRPLDGDGDGVATCDVGAYELHELTAVPVEIPVLSPVGGLGLAALLVGAAWTALRRRDSKIRS